MNRLKELREEAAMTVRELSERSGVSEDTITKLENAHRKGRGMTMRKLAKALSTTPEQLFPEDFEQRSSATTSAPVILAQDDFFGSRMASSQPSHTDVRGTQALEDAIAGAYEVMHAVEGSAEKVSLQARLLDSVPRMNISERQQKVLITVLECGEVGPSTVAERLEISVSTAYRDLSVLEEHGLVQAHESGKRLISPLGKDVVDAIVSAWSKSPHKRSSREKSYFDEALDHIATLMKAYEEVARFNPRRVTEREAQSLLALQESILRSVERIAAAAQHSSLISKARENLRVNASKPDSAKSPAEWVQDILNQLMSDPPTLRTIEADIEGLSQTEVLMALLPMIAADDIGRGPDDPYKKFRQNLEHPSDRYAATRKGGSDDLLQTSVRKPGS